MPQLVIVRRDDHLLYSYLKTHLERRDIAVIQDRRAGERRQGPVAVDLDGRKGDRRTSMMLKQTRELKDLGFVAIAQ